MDLQDTTGVGQDTESMPYSRSFMRWAGSERVTLAIVITDIVGSTALGVELGDDGMNVVRRAHFRQTRQLIEEFSGQEVKITGDGFIAAFRSVPAALDYALAILAEPGISVLRNRIRAGIHIGPVQPDEGDIFGHTVNVALQVVGAIPNDGISLSDAAMHDLEDLRAERYNDLSWEKQQNTESDASIFTLWSLLIIPQQIVELTEETRYLDAVHNRLVATAALFALIFLVIILRAVEVVLFTGTAEAQAFQDFQQPRPRHGDLVGRADIVDRDGRLLATMLDSPSLYVDPRRIHDADATAQSIAGALPELNAIELRAKLNSDKSFAWVTRHLTPREQYRINQLNIPEIHFGGDLKRVYPFGDLTAHVVGFCNIDNDGVSGLEQALDKRIRADQAPIELSLHIGVQAVLDRELMQLVNDTSAEGAAGVVMDVNTGEIIAMVSLPDFDSNHPVTSDPDLTPVETKERMLNKVTLGDYEMGSLMRIFYSAMVLDAGVATLNSRFDARHQIHDGELTISDFNGKHRWLTIPEIIVYSSNVGLAHMAENGGPILQNDYLSRFGFLIPTPIELGEVTKPHYKRPWQELNTGTIAIGYGLALSPLNVITAASAIVNGGVLRPATLLKVPSGATLPGQRVISANTSEQMRKLMRLVVERQSGEMTFAFGYVGGAVSGLTRTIPGAYDHQNLLLATFIDAFPMNNPKYIVFTMLNKPRLSKANPRDANMWIMGPANSRIIQRIAPMLRVGPVDERSLEPNRTLH